MSEELLEKKVDLRIRRTYKLLLDALVSLLEEKSFEEIRVTDICDRAMVHRTTFYKHFEDKYDLLKYGITEVQKNFEQESTANQSFDNSKQYYIHILRRVLVFLAANKNMYLQLMKKNGSSAISAIFHKLIVEDVKSKLEKYDINILHTIPIPVIAEFYAGAFIALTGWWLENNMPYSEEEMLSFVDLMMNIK